jgi:hypothetical protein
MSNLTVGQLSSNDPVTNLIGVAPGDTVYSPGSVVQMVNTIITTPTAVSVGASRIRVSIPDLTCVITPKSAASKIYITVRWFGEFAPQNASYNTMWGVFRNGVAVLAPTSGGGASGITMASIGYWADDANSTPEMAMFDYLDSPASTSALTYSVYVEATTASTLYTNRTVVAGAAAYEYGSSSITLWEIAQ